MKLNKTLKQREITAKQLSEQTGIKYRTMLKYSCGERNLTVDAAKIIGKALDINWWLFFEDEKEVQNEPINSNRKQPDLR